MLKIVGKCHRTLWFTFYSTGYWSRNQSPWGKSYKADNIMADKLRPDELAAFKAAFDMFDKNQDGTISTKV